MNAGTLSSLLLIQSVTSAHGLVLPTFRVSLPTSSNLSRHILTHVRSRVSLEGSQSSQVDGDDELPLLSLFLDKFQSNLWYVFLHYGSCVCVCATIRAQYLVCAVPELYWATLTALFSSLLPT